MQNNICSYSDDYMFYNERSGHYELTEKALMEMYGINIRARIAQNSTINPEIVIQNFVRTVSDMVYQFIHEHNVDNCRQDYLISHIPELRDIIQRAMGYQAVYVMNVGNLYLSPKPEERAAAIDYLCQSVLNNVVPGLGVSILYSGVI